MEQAKADPRTLRTRKFIIDAFLKLSRTYDFQDIRVKDITEEAMINRATFYNHFIDKYDLLEQVVAEKLSFTLNCEVKQPDLSIEEVVEEVFLSLTAFGETAHDLFRTPDEIETVNRILQAELTHIFSTMLVQRQVAADLQVIQRLANLLTKSVVGMSEDWLKSKKDSSPKDYLDSLLPFLLNGLKG